MKNPLFYGNNGRTYHYFGIQGFGADVEVVVFVRAGFSLGPAGEVSEGTVTFTISLIWVDINIHIPIPFAN